MTYHMNLQFTRNSFSISISGRGKKCRNPWYNVFPQPHVRLNSGSKLYWLACDKPVGPCENNLDTKRKKPKMKMEMEI